MNKRVIVILGLLVSVLAVLWLGHMLTSPKHETGLPSTFRITPFDQRSKAFVLERESKWLSVDRDYSPISDLIRALGLVPSVRSLTSLLNSSTPEYRRWKLYKWLYPRQAIAANALANMKEDYLELATLDNTNANPTLQISDDGHLGLLWFGTNAVIVFQDLSNGFKLTQYREKANASRSEHLSTEGSLLADSHAPPGPSTANSEAVKAAIAQLQGEWSMVSGADGGKPPAAVKRIFQGDEVTTTLAGQPYFTEKITIDPSKTPKTIDFEMTNGAGTSIKQLGIYELGADRLRLCIANPSDHRPTKFSGRREQGGGALSVWKREKSRGHPQDSQ